MFDMIADYIPLCMKYKLPEEYRYRNTVNLRSESEIGYVFIPNKILSKESYNSIKGCEKYDIETETHNYVVHDSLVHNSSQRTSNAIKDTKKIMPYWIHKVLSFAKIKPKSNRTWELGELF